MFSASPVQNCILLNFLHTGIQSDMLRLINQLYQWMDSFGGVIPGNRASPLRNVSFKNRGDRSFHYVKCSSCQVNVNIRKGALELEEWRKHGRQLLLKVFSLKSDNVQDQFEIGFWKLVLV